MIQGYFIDNYSLSVRGKDGKTTEDNTVYENISPINIAASAPVSLWVSRYPTTHLL